MKLGRILTILYILDNLVLALLTLGKCRIGETLSSVAWELEIDNKRGKIMRPIIDALFRVIEKDHCFRAWFTYQLLTKATRD